MIFTQIVVIATKKFSFIRTYKKTFPLRLKIEQLDILEEATPWKIQNRCPIALFFHDLIRARFKSSFDLKTK